MFLYGFVALFFVNSLVDLSRQLEFYLPRLDQIYKRTLDDAERSAADLSPVPPMHLSASMPTAARTSRAGRRSHLTPARSDAGRPAGLNRPRS